ncbi:DUF6786 family protein [uncultured Polaribacter sp.]|uniref:DUF6786 family protein n=1 Tax=uncultured Polaribacter sp. TaxID=174711 RepID=UPI002634AA81|nr:DUF6786 family protein [uncultured Polaribacter sp.]
MSIPIFKIKKIPIFYFLFIGMLFFECKTNQKKKANTMNEKSTVTTYQNDIDFLKNHTQIIELAGEDGNARIAVAPALQGRIMTSSASGNAGSSYGWINRALFIAKDTLEHINAYGGEERFWLGPEGGQYSIFFKKGADFTLKNWQTPRLIDLAPFNVKTKTSNKVVFTKNAAITNYAGFQFDMNIEREVSLLTNQEIRTELGINNLEGLHTVGYSTKNTLTNSGKKDWKKETGLLSIWLLGMFNHSPTTTIVVPYVSGDESELGIAVNDTYFGKVPSDRLVVKENVIFFKGDGKYRSKIGLSPLRAKDILGSYDATNNVLTLVTYNKPKGVTEYVNSMWEIQEQPYAGDVVNSYNDGAPAPGEKPLGPFYELETSSPALELEVGESATHIQYTFHIEGNKEKLSAISEKMLGVSLEEIHNAF